MGRWGSGISAMVATTLLSAACLSGLFASQARGREPSPPVPLASSILTHRGPVSEEGTGSWGPLGQLPQRSLLTWLRRGSTLPCLAESESTRQRQRGDPVR